ncbi:Dam family site-specific DNA-(adenine-N6)-methyltransferase [Marinilabiliaceae bacterium JC017]|nr:Dam family site-specific DNA-(adenine-N6)-methyltransferase [Marinilabiliaceae bacterium JC017]
MSNVTPFLKWPGGKRWLTSYIEELIDKQSINRYFEPFLGGGAVFFSINPQESYLSDTNEQLIITYKAVQNNHEELIRHLKEIPTDKATYYKVRNGKPTSEIDIAVRFLYLNRLAFGGMYRVNKEGNFNVPYGGSGRSTNVLWKNQLIENASKKLKNVKLSCQDFSETFSIAEKGDLIYCDPPYTVAHNLNGFQRYNENIFTWKDQKRLKELCTEAADRGVCIILSNAAHLCIKELYYPKEPKVIKRYSGLSTVPSKRKVVEEYLLAFNL